MIAPKRCLCSNSVSHILWLYLSRYSWIIGQFKMRAIHFSNHVPTHIKNHLHAYDEAFWHVSVEVHVDENQVQIIDINGALSPLKLSFVDPKTETFLRKINNQQPLIKACNISNNSTKAIKIIDLTAGMGQDSLILSTLNQPLISIERNKLSAAILQTLVYQYLEKKPHDWTVIQDCSLNWLSQKTKSSASHIYLDPFFNKRKSALPKNTMQWTQKFGKEDPKTDDNALFRLALAHAKERVIVKRDKKACFIGGKKPNQGSIIQKTSRFDCYKPPSQSNDSIAMG